MRRPDSQSARILAHLKAGRRLTPLGALELCGCFRLAARIHDLRLDGYKITMRKHAAGYAVYTLA